MIVFRHLTVDDLKHVIDLELTKVRERLLETRPEAGADRRGQGVPHQEGLEHRLRRPSAAPGDRELRRGSAVRGAAQGRVPRQGHDHRRCHQGRRRQAPPAGLQGLGHQPPPAGARGASRKPPKRPPSSLWQQVEPTCLITEFNDPGPNRPGFFVGLAASESRRLAVQDLRSVSVRATWPAILRRSDFRLWKSGILPYLKSSVAGWNLTPAFVVQALPAEPPAHRARLAQACNFIARGLRATIIRDLLVWDRLCPN